MLGSYMEDIGITAKEFEAACTQGRSITGKFHQQLFEQVLPSFLLFCCLHTTTSGLGRGWLWDFQENDDPEEHWSANGSTGVVTTKVQIHDKFQMKKPTSKIHATFQMKKSKSRIQIPGMECFLSLSNLPRSLLQWRGRIKLCRRWQGSSKNEIILCNSQIFRKHIQSYAESDEVRYILSHILKVHTQIVSILQIIQCHTWRKKQEQ